MRLKTKRKNILFRHRAFFPDRGMAVLHDRRTHILYGFSISCAKTRSLLLKYLATVSRRLACCSRFIRSKAHTFTAPATWIRHPRRREPHLWVVPFPLIAVYSRLSRPSHNSAVYFGRIRRAPVLREKVMSSMDMCVSSRSRVVTVPGGVFVVL